MSIIFSIKTVVDFEKKLIEISEKLSLKIDVVGKILLGDEIDDAIRRRILIYNKCSVDFFIGRAIYIVNSLKSDIRTKEIVAGSLRGLIDIYCKILYINNSDPTDAIKRIIWTDFNFLIICGEKADNHRIIKLDYKILKEKNINFPAIQDFRVMFRDYTFNFKKNRYPQLSKEFGFPSIRQVIQKYHDEYNKPLIKKGDLYHEFQYFSEQIHANPYTESLTISPHTDPQYKLIGYLILVHSKFIKSIAKSLNITEIVKEIDEQIDFFEKNINKNFIQLWKIDNHLY